MSQTQRQINEDILSEEMMVEISAFITKKRKKVIDILYRCIKISHGELAESCDSSTTALSNLLLVFDKFKYKLIDSRSEGKYRYYFLTELGRAYVEKCRLVENNLESEKIVQHEILRMLQENRDCLMEFQRINPDDWEIRLDDSLIARVNCCKVSGEKSELLVDQFIGNTEKLMLVDPLVIDKILRLLGDDAILRGRLVRFIEKFEPFQILLNSVKTEENMLWIYELLQALIEHNMIKAKEYIQQLEWTDGYVKELSSALEGLIRQLGHKDTTDIYDCLCRYLAGNHALCAFITNLIKNHFERNIQKNV